MRNFTKLLIRTVVVSLCLLSTLAFATGFQSGDYQVYTADINGDGDVDILLRGTLVPIAVDDLMIFIPLRQSVIILSDGNGGYYIDSAPSQSMLNNTLWTSGGYELLSGDFQGDGNNDLLLRALTPGNSSFILSFTTGQTAPTLSQELSPAVFGLDFGAEGIDVTLPDVNGDGRSDIQVNLDGQILAVLLSDSSGMFIPRSENDKKATIDAVWAGLRISLDDGDATAALQFYSITAQGKYSQIFTDLDTAITTMTSFWSSATPISITDNFAEYAIRQTVDGQTRLHLIRFMRDDQGRWLIEDM